MKKPTGFTLIELMVVIAILSILAALLFSSYAVYMEKARITAMFHNGYEIRRTLAIFYNDHGRFPVSRDEAIEVISKNLMPHNIPYPWNGTTILDEDIYTKSCYKAIPEGSSMPSDYVWLWPLPNRKITNYAARTFFHVVVEIPYDITCNNAPAGTQYFIAVTSSTVLVVGER